ncbi:MAG: hypothetical protein JWO94_3426 [Verrucomicrobiaceae bacterium]|nr:hypothetical protein [Verrucomicrobiaceae bacterium]
MPLSSHTLQSLLTASEAEAWSSIRDLMAETWLIPYQAGAELSEVRRREAGLASLDLLLSHSIWPLWQNFPAGVPRAATQLVKFWETQLGGRAVLLLDSLSLRELPLLIMAAQSRGFSVHDSAVCASELPPETTTFAKALGFSSRGALDNNGAASIAFPGAFTLSHNLPWRDAADAVPPAPNIFCWHHWPDERLHQLDRADGGLEKLFPEMLRQLTGDDFWQFVQRLATGRRLVITSDHGYAATGAFPNVPAEQKDYLRETFAAQRFRSGAIDANAWLPPLTTTVTTASGLVTFVLGRQKWQVPGGFPALSHGGLTLMETFVPWIELSLSKKE